LHGFGLAVDSWNEFAVATFDVTMRRQTGKSRRIIEKRSCRFNRTCTELMHLLEQKIAKSAQIPLTR
jgi:hypothetical protein